MLASNPAPGKPGLVPETEHTPEYLLGHLLGCAYSILEDCVCRAKNGRHPLPEELRRMQELLAAIKAL
jgi:hypothetical protein